MAAKSDLVTDGGDVKINCDQGSVVAEVENFGFS